MTNSPSDAATKSCACTGVRWCAKCRDPLIRQSRRMDDPVQIPDLLSKRPSHSDPNTHDRIHVFDLDLQCAPSYPAFEGIHVIRDFLSADEARHLMTEIERAPFVPAQSGKLKQHYGPKINFNKQKINATSFKGPPEYARRIESRLRNLAQQDFPDGSTHNMTLHIALKTFETTDAFVLQYFEQDESNLDFHRDDSFAYGEVILDLSLESDSVLTFLEGCEPGSTANQRECVRVPLPARSLAVVYGRARFIWEHAILAYDITGRRTSVTLRTLNEALRENDEGRRLLDIARGDQTPDATS
jgi:alkylated DNA repair dioxygenase AlkB